MTYKRILKFAMALGLMALVGNAYSEDDDKVLPFEQPGRDPNFSNIRPNVSLQAHERREQADGASGTWVAEGPWGLGRVHDIAIHPNDENTLLVGPGNGGIWKSTNGGQTWKQTLNNARSQSIGDVTYDQNDPNIVWVGGGETIGGGGSMPYPGAGIYKSTDGGETWEHKGLDSSFYIARVEVTPNNSNKVFAAVLGSLWSRNKQRGVYRSLDGGNTWENVLYVDDSTGASDVRIHPTVPNRIFATFWTAVRNPYARQWTGPACRVWRSDDGGDTWKILGTPEGLPTSDIGRNTMTIAKSNPNFMYLIYFRGNNTLKGVYKSTNGGMNWSRTSGNPPGSMYSFYGQAFCQIRVNPYNHNDVSVLGISSYRSTNGGTSWSRTFLNTHADDHALVWGSNSNTVYLGDDGGLWKSTNGQNGTWRTIADDPNTGINMTMIYTMDVANDNDNYVYIGTQDNGTQRTTNGGGSWGSIIGGDGMYVRVDQGNPTYVIGAWQYGNFQRSSQRGAGMAAIQGISGRLQWAAPVDIDPSDGRAYLGGQYLYRGNRGSGSFTRISNDLTNGDHSAANYPYGSLTALSAFNGVVYAGTDDGNLWVTQNGRVGSPSWSKIRNGALGAGVGDYQFDGWFRKITHDRSIANGSVAYAAISYYRWGKEYWAPSIYKISNFGASPTDWVDISGDLPAYATTNKVIKDNAPTRAGWLYVATDYGMFYSTNDGVNWNWLGDKNLPIVAVNDMKLHEASQTLYVATYGRGYWTIDLTQVTPVKKSWSESKTQNLRSFPNPITDIANIQFTLERTQKVNLAVYNISGKLVKTLLNKKMDSKKVHRLTWDRKDEFGSKVGPGNYILRAIGDKITMARKLIVK